MIDKILKSALAESIYNFLGIVAITGWSIFLTMVLVHFLFGVDFDVYATPSDYALNTANKLCQPFGGYEQESMNFKRTYNSKYGVKFNKFTFSCINSDAKMSIVYYEN